MTNFINMNKKIIIISVIALVIGISGVIGFNYRSSNKPRTIYLSNALIELTPEQIVKQSQGVVVGSVENIEVIKAASKVRSGEEDILTKATVKVEKFLKTPENFSNSTSIIEIEVIGGTIGNETMVTEDSPALEKGERIVVFLGPEDTNTNAFTVYGGAQGKFTIQADGKIGNEKERVYFRKVFGKDMTLNEFENKILLINSSPSN